MKIEVGTKVIIKLTSLPDVHIVTEVEELVPYDPAAYQHSSGLSVFTLDGRDEYFIDEGGIVWQGDTSVGVAPVLKSWADQREAELDALYAEGGM